ncbi:MAG: glycoside hydrolase family 15 protein [Thermoguttaceae bacterium]
MSRPIEDYALIGNCRTAALVGKDGSIDWLCFPRFDSGACFAALLGTDEHGHWTIAPREPVVRVSRRYRPGTLVLETDMTTPSGRVRLIDFMVPHGPEHELVRIVEGLEGRVDMAMDLTVRFDYGSIVPWVRRVEGGLRATAGPETIYCRSDVDLWGQGKHTRAEFSVSPGERIGFQLMWTLTHDARPPLTHLPVRLDETERWWRAWSDQCRYEGPWREDVLRSLITLKALTYEPTGGIVAAATTSLPEHIGGVRNWDYRYCWLRDATFTLYALMVGGYLEEARAWRQWLVNAVAGTPSQLQIMYGVGAERRLTEIELDWLPGYEDSRPVRIGNAAYHQHQLDVYGEIMDALHVARGRGLPLDDEAWQIQRAMIDFVGKVWQLPDEGIWEIRGPRRHFTHSKVMAWVALDRAIKEVERFGLEGDVQRWRQVRDHIHQQVSERAFDPRSNSFVQFYEGDHVDASLLMLPLVGFLPADDPRIQGTVARIERELVHDGFVDRYRTETDVDGLPGGEGAFLLCSFWLVDCLALQGRYDQAASHFERLLALRNDVGLLAEQYDPRTARMLGNFPQAFSHIGLINSARNLARPGGPAEIRPLT